MSNNNNVNNNENNTKNNANVNNIAVVNDKLDLGRKGSSFGESSK
jgi:hypothetical protein